jgi:4-amino-4-deoxy-L-arabinose transferase-like glycosyltransferase
MLRPESSSNVGQKVKVVINRIGSKILFVIFIVAFIVRFSYVWLDRWWGGDSAAYLAIAKNIAFYHSFSGTTGIPTASRPPLYPLLIAAFWWTDSAPIIAVELVQVICGAATVVLIYLIAKDRFSHRVALLAALAATFAPMTVHYVAVILTETVFTFLITLGFFFWGRNHGVAAGLAFGLAALTRSTVIPFLGCLVLLAFLPRWQHNRRLYLLIFVSATAVASVWIMRNAVVFRKFILVQSLGYGVNLFAGTIETQMYGDDVWTKVIKQLGSDNDNSQDEPYVDRKFMWRAVTRIETDLPQYLRVRLKQYPRLFLDSGDYLLGSSNIKFDEALQKRRALVVITKISFILGNVAIFVLALYAIFLERKRVVSLSHIILFPVFLSLIHLPLWIESRYSLPMMPLTLILAARGTEGLWNSQRLGRIMTRKNDESTDHLP